MNTVEVKTIRRGPDTLGYDETFEQFSDGFKRLKLAVVAHGLVLYLKNEGIKNLILPDRGARPLFWAAWHLWFKQYQGKPFPSDCYFVNPRGFLNFQDYLEKDPKTGMQRSQKEINKALDNNDVVDLDYMGRSQEDIAKELIQKYPILIVNKREPTLLFDNCMHSGHTMIALVRTLERAGFNDLTIGVVAQRDNRDLLPDFYLLDSFEDTCLVFGTDQGIKKTPNHVFSQVAKDEYSRLRALNLRRDIKRIILSTPL